MGKLFFWRQNISRIYFVGNRGRCAPEFIMGPYRAWPPFWFIRRDRYRTINKSFPPFSRESKSWEIHLGAAVPERGGGFELSWLLGAFWRKSFFFRAKKFFFEDFSFSVGISGAREKSPLLSLHFCRIFPNSEERRLEKDHQFIFHG